MSRANKLFFVVIGLILAVVICNLTGLVLGSQTGALVSSAASIAQSQALSEQARANQQMAEALQSVAHTMNLMLIVVLFLGLGGGLYIWKTRNQNLPRQAPRETSFSGLPLTPPLHVVNAPRASLTKEDMPDFQTAEILEALLSGEEWEAP